MVRYLTALRIGEAKRLIREGNLTFTQIAERIGIESIYYFSNLFIESCFFIITIWYFLTSFETVVICYFILIFQFT